MGNIPTQVVVSVLLILAFQLESCVSSRDHVKASIPLNEPKNILASYAQSAWIGHNASELLLKYGEPDSILEARPKGTSYKDGIPAYTLVYLHQQDKKCIDAYVVAVGTRQIIRYYCR
jgi:hypothetical protein